MTEMQKLIKLLDSESIPYDLVDDVMGNTNNQVFYPCMEKSICDVICHHYSYGGRDGLLEIMGLVDEEKIGDTVEGWLTATQVFSRIQKDYHSRKIN